MVKSGWWAVAAILGAFAAAAGATALWWRQPAPPAPPPVRIATDPDDDIEEPAAANPGYLGPHSCAPCHAQRVAEFQKTSHFRACRVPTSGPMPTGFTPGKGTHRTHDPALRFEMARAGDDFIETAVHETPAGEQRTSARIDLVYGANNADEVFFSWRGDRLYELPVAWLHPLNRWGNTSYNPYGPGDYSREATPRCLECHNTWFPHVPGTPNQYRRDELILGVTCERCHGPGREHVAFHQAHPQDQVAHAVLHPGRLGRERQLEVCTQCHSNAIKPRGPAFGYRPGEPLADSFRTVVSKHPEDDHVANQVQYLRQSKCFQKSDLTCTTCHNPHRMEGPATIDHSCTKCHQPADCTDRDRLPAAVRDSCVGCHMPARVWMNVHFHTDDDQYVPPIRRHEHRIGVYPEARQEVLLAWYRTQSDAQSRQEATDLTKALVEHWLTEADKRRRDHRFLAAIGAVREAVRLDPAPAARDRLRQAVAIQARLDADWAEALHQADERRYPEAIATLEKVLAVKPDWALVRGKLGTLYAATGKKDLAVKQLREATRCDPDDPYGWNMLGWMAYLEDRAEEAADDFRRADEAEPFTAEIKFRWGLALMKLGQWADAEQRFRQALVVDPNSVGACQGLAHALRRQGHAADAVCFARRAARLTQERNPDVLLGLAESYADAGRFAEADAAAERALEVARATDPKLVPQIRLRQDEIRARARK